MAFSSLPRALALCFVAVLVLAASAASAQPPTDDTHTTLLYHFRTNTTALSNGTVHAWQPSVCQGVNNASIKLVSATQHAERNGTLTYTVYIQRFLHSSDCSGAAEPQRAADIAASGTLDDVFDNSEVTSFPLFGDDVFDGPFAGLIVLGSIDIETPMSRFAWTLNYNYTYDGQLFLGTVKESLVCTPINNDFSLLWVAEAHVPMSAPSAVLINTSLHYYPGSIDCTGAASHGESDFQSVDDKVGTVTFPFTPRGMRDVLPAGLWVGSTYSLTIGPKPTPPPSNYSSSSSSSSTGAGPAPESSSTGPAPQPPTPKPTPDFAWGLIFSYSYAGEPYTGPVSESKGDSAVVCTKINNTFSLQWKADAALGGVNNSDVVIANRLSYFPASLDCTGQSARTNNFTVSTDDKDEVYNGTLALMSTEGMPAGLKVYSTYKLAISHPQPPPGPQPDNDGGSGGMSKGTKTLLIALGASAGALILFAGIYCACCKKKPETQHYETAHGNANYQNMA